MIGLQPLQRFIELGCCSRLSATVDLGHQKSLLPITIAQSLAHANLALASVVVPAVIQKIDSFIESCANNLDALFRSALASQVIPSEPDQRYLFTGAAQRSIWNPILAIALCGPT